MKKSIEIPEALPDSPAYRFRQGSVCATDISAEIEIEASVSRVWQILTDFPNYAAWNAFTPSVHCDLRLGGPVTMQVCFPGAKPRKQVEWLNVVEPERCLAWGVHMGHRALINANRYQILTPLAENRTHYYTVDRFSGLVVPLVSLLYGEKVRAGFQLVAKGLKRHAENS